MTRSLPLVLALALFSACAQDAPPQPSAIAPLSVAGAAATDVKGAVPENFNTHLTGEHEVPPRDTRAQGQAIFKLNREGTELSYRLIVANIDNVIASHIHLGGPTVNGNVVAFLFGPVPPGGGRSSGVFATGTITAADLINDLAGQPLSALMAHIRAGNAYVNVHTNDGVAPTNTGPGDFPGGEVRGQLP